MKNCKLIVPGVLLGLLLFGCTKDSEPVAPNPGIDYGNIGSIEYSQHVQPLLDEFSKILQDAGVFPPGLQMDSWSNLMKGWERGEAVIPFDAENSLLVELATKLTYANPLDSVKIAFLKRWINEGAKNDAGEVPGADARNLLYVCSQGEAIVHIIDADRLVVVRNVDLTDFGLPRSAKPHHIAFTPDGQFWFVSCIDNQVNKVLKFTVADNQLVGEFTSFIPALLDHHPTDAQLYVSRFMLNNNTNSIVLLNSQVMRGYDDAGGEILLPPNESIPHAMKISHSGQYVYTASFAEDAFLVVDHATKSFADVVFLGNDRTPLQVAVSPDDRQVFISCIGTGEIVVLDVSDPANRHEVAAVPVGGQPWHGTFHVDGSTFYVGNLAMNKLDVINTADYSFQSFGAGDGSDGLAEPHGIEIHPDGSRVFISSRNTRSGYHPYYDFGDNSQAGTVVVFNTANHAIEKIIEIENFGSGMRLLQK